MAYRSKNIKPALARLSSAKNVKMSRLTQAQNNLRDFASGMKDSLKIDKQMGDLASAAPLVNILQKRINIKKDEYNDMKDFASTLIKENEEFSFPTFDEYKNRSKKATVGGKQYSMSQLKLLMEDTPRELIDLMEGLNAQ